MSDALHIVTNNHTRPLMALCELPSGVAASEFDYLDTDAMAATGEDYSPRFFSYRGSWYDSHEFEVAPHSIKRHGFDGVQVQSHWDCVALRYFDADGYEYGDSVVVAHIHW